MKSAKKEKKGNRKFQIFCPLEFLHGGGGGEVTIEVFIAF